MVVMIWWWWWWWQYILKRGKRAITLERENCPWTFPQKFINLSLILSQMFTLNLNLWWPYGCFVSLNELSFSEGIFSTLLKKVQSECSLFDGILPSLQGGSQPLWFYLKFKLYSWKTLVFFSSSVSSEKWHFLLSKIRPIGDSLSSPGSSSVSPSPRQFPVGRGTVSRLKNQS